MEILFFWIPLAVVVGIWASNRGRSGFGWFIVALLFSPLLAALFLAVMRNLAAQQEAQKAAADMKVCPRCAESVKSQALVCRFCGFEFDQQESLQSRISAISANPILEGSTVATSEPSVKRPFSVGSLWGEVDQSPPVTPSEKLVSPLGAAPQEAEAEPKETKRGKGNKIAIGSLIVLAIFISLYVTQSDVFTSRNSFTPSPTNGVGWRKITGQSSGTVGGGTVLVDADKATNEAVYREAISVLCAHMTHCYVKFWADGALVPKSPGLLSDAELDSQTADYTYNSTTHFEQFLWDCRRFSEKSQTECLSKVAEKSKPRVAEGKPGLPNYILNPSEQDCQKYTCPPPPTPKTEAPRRGAQGFQPCRVIAVGSLTALSDYEIRGALCGAARATVAAIAIDDKVATDECYAAAGNLMVEFVHKRTLYGPSVPSQCVTVTVPSRESKATT